MLADRSTLGQFLLEAARDRADVSGELNALVQNVALACKAVAKRVAGAPFGDVIGGGEQARARGGEHRALDRLAHDLFVRANEWAGLLAGIAGEGMEEPRAIPERYARGPYLLLFEPLDGSENIDLNNAVGSIFSILRAPGGGRAAEPGDFLQPGTSQVCAGYAIYGPATMLVVTVGTGVHGFTLDPQLGEFILTHPFIEIPRATHEFAINASSIRSWEPAVRRYVEECLAGQSGPRGKDFVMRGSVSLVAVVHRILMRGGVYLSPRVTEPRDARGHVRLLFEASPISCLVEQAGGASTTGRGRVLEVKPESLHQPMGLMFGSRDEVERIERYYRDHNVASHDAPLFGLRNLFRTPT